MESGTLKLKCLKMIKLIIKSIIIGTMWKVKHEKTFFLMTKLNCFTINPFLEVHFGHK